MEMTKLSNPTCRWAAGHQYVLWKSTQFMAQTL